MGVLFYFLLILWVIFSIWWHWPEPGATGPRAYLPGVTGALLFLLLFLLGWAVFGSIIK